LQEKYYVCCHCGFDDVAKVADNYVAEQIKEDDESVKVFAIRGRNKKLQNNSQSGKQQCDPKRINVPAR